MKVKRIWVVTKPTKISTLEDICFSADMRYLYLQFAGGLEPDNVHAFYTTEKEAKTAAKWLLGKDG